MAKRKLLESVAATAFNGPLGTAPTAAVLFRLAEPIRRTFYPDEIEKLRRDDKKATLAILNMGYRAGGRATACVYRENSRAIRKHWFSRPPWEWSAQAVSH